jgi:transcription elongation GreA/GreB family factor
MSRAFVKDMDESAGDDLPERPQSPHPNYVTPRGLARLKAQLAELQAEHRRLAESEDLLDKEQLKRIDRDIRYFEGRIDSALLIDPATQPADQVSFGAAVRTVDDNDVERRFEIVGEDEAEVQAGRISYASPLAQALLGARIGDTVMWRRPVGDLGLEVLAIDYPRHAEGEGAA